MNKIMMAAALGAMALGGVATAAGPINLRQLNQERRIDAGVRSGKLTRIEAARLKAEQQSISREEDRRRALHGGKLTANDKAYLDARQERANRAILGQKGDAQRGPNKLKIG